MNRLELRTDLRDLVNSGAGSAHADFTDDQLNRALNRAQLREVREARVRGSEDYFRAFHQFTWPASAVTLALPAPLKGAQILAMYDMRSGEPGTKLMFDRQPGVVDLYWEDSNTLRWRQDGPSSAITIRAEFIATPFAMTNDVDEATNLIPADYHEILVWSAGVELRTRAEDSSPEMWMHERDTIRAMYWKHVAKGRPVYGNEIGISRTQNVTFDDYY